MLVSGVQQSDLVIHVYICVYFLKIVFHHSYYKILNIQYIQDTEYTVLYSKPLFIHMVVCIS